MAGGGGAWKVAYADFVTAMMALFMVLWIIGQNQKVKEAIAQHFNGEDMPGAGDTGAGQSKKMKDPHSARNLGEGGNRRPVVGARPSDRTSIGVMIYFPPHETALDEKARKQLEAFAPQVLGKPQLIELRGQSSLAEVGGPDHAGDAYQLAYQRCLVVMENLVSQGISPRQLRISQTSPYERPLEGDESPHGDPAARVQVTVLSEWVPSTSDPGRTKKSASPAAAPAHAHDAHH